MMTISSIEGWAAFDFYGLGSLIDKHLSPLFLSHGVSIKCALSLKSENETKFKT